MSLISIRLLTNTFIRLSMMAILGFNTFFVETAQAANQGFISSPLIPLNSTSQGPITLGNYKGKVLLVDFWATWCIPCRVSFPFYQSLHEKYGAQGLVVIGVNNEDDSEAVKKFYTDNGTNFLIVKDQNNALGKLMQPEKMPTSYIIDRKGNIAYIHAGFRPGEETEIEQKVKEFMGK